MGKIQVLEQSVANMIAAGEVVERPASAVKELVENAIDAGATHVTVEIRGGGTGLLRVADNGSGMTREDAQLSLIRHATSKVHTADDLAAIYTLGFRGEALASIAAVSDMELLTRTAEDETGTRLVVEAGTITACEDAGCPRGTAITVTGLFKNTPARLKFLKKDATEAGYVTDMVNKLALANPHVAFKYVRDGKELLFTPGDSSLQNCVFSVFGRDVSRSMLPVEHTEEHIRVAGMTGKPDISRANRNFQNFFINGRYVKCPLMSYALDEAYKNQLMTGKFPACVLNVTVDPAFVDVNVHPTKLEVKFSDERMVYRAVYWAVKNALYAKPHIPQVEDKQRVECMHDGTAQVDTAGSDSAELLRTNRPTGGDAVPSPSVAAVAEPSAANAVQPLAAEPPIAPEARPERVRPFGNEVVFTRPSPAKSTAWDLRRVPAAAEEPAAVLPGQTAAILPEQPAITGSQPAPSYEQAAVAETVEPRVVGQVFDTYIVVERGEEMLLIDQHAAHERLRYEELRRQSESRAVASQGMLIPVVVDLTAAEMAVIQENRDFFEQLGFETEPFGNASIVIRSAPEELDSGAMKSLFVEFVDMLRTSRRSNVADTQSRALYSIACKGALKAKKHLSHTEMQSLVKSVFALENINTCPHGRPITIAFTKLFVEKQFKRVL